MDPIIMAVGPSECSTRSGSPARGIPVTVVEREPDVPAAPRAMSIRRLRRARTAGDPRRRRARRRRRPSDGLNVHDFAGGEVIRWPMEVLKGHVAHPYNVHLGQARLARDRAGPPRPSCRTPGCCGARRSPDCATRATWPSWRVEGPDGAQEIRASWVIGADGARSTVRRLVGLEFEGTTWPERCVATNIRYPFDEHGFGGANMVVDPALGAIVARIDETGLWRCTYCETADLPEETIPERMPDFFRAFLPDDRQPEVVAWSPYRMHQRAAESMRGGRVLLAGDAAHATNPTGGLG